MIDFSDDVVVVTGAGSGLGRSHALAGAARGAAVLVNDPAVEPDGSPRADAVVEHIRVAGGTAVARHDVKVNAVAPGAHTRLTEEISAGHAKRLAPELVTPLVAYLCSRECEPTGEVFAAAAGHLARVFVVETPGIDLTGAIEPEDIAADYEQIASEDGYFVPRTLADEVRGWLRDRV